MRATVSTVASKRDTQISRKTHRPAIPGFESCKVVGIVTREAAHLVRLEVVPGALGRIGLSARSVEVGDGEMALDAQVDGETLEIGFNGAYLQQALAAIETPMAALSFNGASSPVLARPAPDEGEDGFLHVLMPMHLS